MKRWLKFLFAATAVTGLLLFASSRIQPGCRKTGFEPQLVPSTRLSTLINQGNTRLTRNVNPPIICSMFHGSSCLRFRNGIFAQKTHFTGYCRLSARVALRMQVTVIWTLSIPKTEACCMYRLTWTGKPGVSYSKPHIIIPMPLSTGILMISSLAQQTSLIRWRFHPKEGFTVLHS